MDKDNKYGLLEMQIQLLSLLKTFDKFCEDNDIVYSLEGGTLLGAIRHNGFIPWDDDIDILMDRPNHTKLLKLIRNSEYLNIRNVLWIYRVFCAQSNSGNDYVPSIDVMVLDKTPSSFIMKHLKLLVIKFMQGMMKKENPIFRNISIFSKIISIVPYIIGKLFSEDIKLKLYHCISQFGNKSHSDTVSIYNNMYKFLHLEFRNDILDNVIRHKFEDIDLPIMADYVPYLISIYGDDYMTPPPMQERIPLHSN